MNKNIKKDLNNNKPPYQIVNQRKIFNLFFVVIVFSLFLLGNFIILFEVQFSIVSKITAFFVSVFSLLVLYQSLFFKYVKSYEDKIVIKYLFLKEIIIFRKNIISEIDFRRPFFDNSFIFIVRGKISIKIFVIPCLIDTEYYDL